MPVLKGYPLRDDMLEFVQIETGVGNGDIMPAVRTCYGCFGTVHPGV